jgi:hypothetical protein
METTVLVKMIDRLPADKKKEVEDFVSGLFTGTGSALEITKKERMKFGDLKGFVKYIAADFDEPLEDFKDYM